MSPYRFLSLRTIARYERIARELGVSEVARSSRGFLAAYKRAGGRASALPESWHRKRNAFIKRHMAQAIKRAERLGGAELPSRRHIALIMWAYSPNSGVR